MFSYKIKHNDYRCDAVLKKFLDDLHRNSEKVNYTDMINIVVIYSYSTDEFVQVNTSIIFVSIISYYLM